MKKKICVVVQRYGLEVNGGAELHSRLLTERLNELYDVEVFTTKAIDYITWKNEYKEDISDVNGITVHRFPVAQERNLGKFCKLNDSFKPQIPASYRREMNFLKSQGPYCPELIKAIKKNKDKYDVFIFFTYLYYTTIFGVAEVYEKSILIPTAHDEPYIKMAILRDMFKKTKAIFYNTEIERSMVQSIFQNDTTRNEIGGIGLDEIIVSDEPLDKNWGRYIVYVGRIEEGKLCHELFQYFGQYKRDYGTDIKLVMVGKSAMKIPKTPDIIAAGFVSDEEKNRIVANAMALVLPSEFESLSMVVLEAMMMRVPVLVNGKCAVTKDHCVKSNAGLYYTNYLEFEGCMEYLRMHPELKALMGENGEKYVKSNYSWKVIIDKLVGLINYVSEN